MRRVVITGLGVVSPVGIGKEAFWDSLIHGRSGITRITRFDPSDFPSQIAGEVKDFNPEDFIPKGASKISRFSQFAVAAAKMAVEDAGLDISSDPYRIGACFGTSIGGGGWPFEKAHLEFLNKGPEGVWPFAALEYSSHAPTSYVCIFLGIQGPGVTVASACATGLDVIEWGRTQIRSGKLKAVIVGGTEAPLYPFSFAAFCATGTLSSRNEEPKRASRPYDLYRNGLVLSEGAAAVVLEDMDYALDRGARIYAEVVGFSGASEGMHLRKVDLEGKTLARAIKRALDDANLNPEEVDYICAHGNSMPDYDISETNAFKKALGEYVYHIPISSIKSVMGQPLGSAGAFQVVSSCMSLKYNLIPPTINLEVPDPRCDLDYVPNQARSARIRTVLMNAHSLGGMHSVLVLRNPGATK